MKLFRGFGKKNDQPSYTHTIMVPPGTKIQTSILIAMDDKGLTFLGGRFLEYPSRPGEQVLDVAHCLAMISAALYVLINDARKVSNIAGEKQIEVVPTLPPVGA